MPWIFFAIVSILTMSVASLLTRVLMKDDKSDAVAYAIIFQFLMTLIVAVFAFWNGFHPPPTQYGWNFAFSGILYGIASICMFQSMKYLEASEAVILSASGTIITIIASILFLHEIFTPVKILGTILILIAMIFVNQVKKLIFNKGTLYAFISIALSSIAVVNDAFILKTYNALSYSAIMTFLPGFVILLFQPSAICRFRGIILGKNFRTMVILAIFYGIQVITYYSALALGAGASQMGPIFKANIILTVLLAAVFLRERDYLLTKCLSAVLVTAGVLLLM
jgi:uncharacterized membrane protein